MASSALITNLDFQKLHSLKIDLSIKQLSNFALKKINIVQRTFNN